LYERYNVKVEEETKEEEKPLNQRPIQELSNVELCKLILQNLLSYLKTNKLISTIILMLLIIIIDEILASIDTSSSAIDNTAATTDKAKKPFGQLDADSHKRNNPFAEEGSYTVMEGFLEVKRVGNKTKQELELQEMYNSKTKAWWSHLCPDKRFELERHDYEPRHGDICRAKGGGNLFECPLGCHETTGSPPFCANDEGKHVSTEPKEHCSFGLCNFEKGSRPCRVQRSPDAPPEYRCDAGSVCILAVGTPIQQFKGNGEYYDDTCNNTCVDGRISSGRISGLLRSSEWKCETDLDCSLSGVCARNGKCRCDAWAEGIDCSYLQFKPVDKSRLGYLHEDHSSWGGSIVQKGNNGDYQMYLSEIICKEDTKTQKRCGLNNWETHSRIVLATSRNIQGPYMRRKVILPVEHHNPSIHISPTTGDWHLYSISDSTGPIVRMISKNEGKEWDMPMILSPQQNPGPLLKDEGSTYLFYRADGMDLPSPTCSDEGISYQYCPSDDDPCTLPSDKPIFNHTGEDPSVFTDHRGNYHMLFNALPYKCQPKLKQGGHSWSLDGVNWSEPRVGAFDTTIQFTDGSSMTCERRERPQMVIDKDGKPLALVTGVTGCPRELGDDMEVEDSKSNGKFYKGGDDSFTLVQLMNS